MPENISTSDVTSPSSGETTTPTPSPSPAPDSTAPSSSAPDATPSPSSGDTRQSDREGLLAAVRKVAEAKPEPQVLPSDGDEDTIDAETDGRDQLLQDQPAGPGRDQPALEAQTPDDPNQIELPDPSEAELKKLRPETRRRFERLLKQRNEARQAYDAVQPELQQHRTLQGYLNEHQLAPEDVNTLLGVGSALRRGDYQAFLDGVAPYVIAAQERLGYRISTDLQRQVDEGLIDEATARDLTRTRHRAAEAEARLQDANRVVDTTRQTQALDNIRGAVDLWEEGIKARDPDYARMAGAVRRYAQGLLQERGHPRNPQEAVALTQAAYDEVRAQFGTARPVPRPTRQSPSSIHVATGTSTAEPRTMREAAVMALANMRRAS